MPLARCIHRFNCLADRTSAADKRNLPSIGRPRWLVFIGLSHRPLLQCTGAHIYGPNVVASLECAIRCKRDHAAIWREVRFTIVAVSKGELLHLRSIWLH